MNIRKEMAQEILGIIAVEQKVEDTIAQITEFCQKEARVRAVYFVDIFNKDEKGFIPCIAVEGEKGYNRTDWHWDCSLAMAEEICKEKNTQMGYTDKEIFSIIASTMSFKQERIMTTHIIDSRDLIEEMNELESELECHIEDGFLEEDFDDLERLKTLREVNRDGEDYSSEWADGTSLIPEEDFEDYAREYFEECYDIPDFVINYIDWESVASDLQMDYTTIEIDGETYWMR